MNKAIKFVVAAFSLALAVQGAGLELYKLKNAKISVGIDAAGNLVELSNVETGHNYASGRQLWRLYYDVPGRKDNQVLGSANKPKVVQGKDSITLSYEGLAAGGQQLKFALILKIMLEDELVRFASEVKNDEPHTIIRELQYPLVGNCNVEEGDRLLTTQRGGHAYKDIKRHIVKIPFTYKSPDQLFRQLVLRYPITASSNCFALFGEKQGLYFGSHDATYEDTGHGARVYPDGKGKFEELELGLYKIPNCLSGASWRNDANVVAPYSGSWHKTSALYRKWVNTWWSHQKPPEWVDEMLGFQRIILRHQYGETFFTYEDFGKRVKEVGKSVGINVAFPFGWWAAGMDNGYPDSYWVTCAEQGGDAAWKRAIAEYRKDGGRVLMYFNGKLIDVESPYYVKGDGKSVATKSNAGTEFYEAYKFSGEGSFSGFYDSRSFVVADMSNPKWMPKLIEMADRAMELGADSVFYDQLGYAETTTHWDRSKEFAIPDLRTIAHKANALKTVHEYINKKNPELAIGTEHITDVTSQHCDYVHGIYGFGGMTVKAHTNFLDWFRYTFPEVILTDRDIDGDEVDVEWQTNRAVLYGLRTNIQTYRLRALIDQTPRYQAYLAKVNKVREQYKDVLVRGTYRDVEGFAKSGDETLQARSFVRGNKMAVVLAHPGKTTLTASISVPGYVFREAGGVGIFKVTAEQTGSQAVKVGKDGLAVLVFEKAAAGRN